jgi:hypothetical protein
MIVLDNVCKKCNRICNTIHFQQNFENWTSGNDDIDEFIQNTQLSTHDDASNVLEWIPYNRFYNIKSIIENKFGKVYRAKWIDGDISHWDNYSKNWKRKNSNKFVILKNLNNLKNISSEFMNKVF